MYSRPSLRSNFRSNSPVGKKKWENRHRFTMTKCPKHSKTRKLRAPLYLKFGEQNVFQRRRESLVFGVVDDNRTTAALAHWRIISFPVVVDQAVVVVLKFPNLRNNYSNSHRFNTMHCTTIVLDISGRICGPSWIIVKISTSFTQFKRAISNQRRRFK